MSLFHYIISKFAYNHTLQPMTKEQIKEKRWNNTIERLRNMPPEKLSKAAKWILKNEESKEEVWIDMRAVLK